ncbi:MAG: urea transporter, partial [Bacteroidia bacterium]|nr:urea transporter [Bacteroidia bacterium]
ASFLSLLLSVSIGGLLYRNGLPFLSVPFILTFWIVALSADAFGTLGLTHHDFFWMKVPEGQQATVLTNLYQNIGSLNFSQLLDIYLRSLSSVLFQNNPLTGAFIAIALLFGSRILFTLSWITLFVAWGLAGIMGAEAANFTFYNIGANYMMIAFAAAGFFTIPSKSSILWAILLIAVSTLVLIFLSKILFLVQLPMFSLPFALVTIGSVHLLSFRSKPKSLIQTPLQLYSPESNLYTYQNNQGRYARFMFYPLHLPFWGNWTVTQGNDGDYTHIGEWKHALDFVILDHDGKSFNHFGTICEDHYCYGKPVLAPADGIIEEVVDQIEDNEIGKINTVQNWGNSLVIRHISGVYTQLSHLKKGSIKVTKGTFVKRGDILAACGNSGRSPVPHLHFQVQTTPFVGSKTVYYPISYFNKQLDETAELLQFSIPKQHDEVSDITPDRLMNNAFDFQPNAVMKLTFTDEKGLKSTECWEANTDAYNYKYLYCKQKETAAYYYCDNGMFYFTAFYGSKKSLLYSFFLSAYKVYLGENESIIMDELPFSLLRNNWLTRGINDFVAPILNLVNVRYTSQRRSVRSKYGANEIILQTKIELRFGHKTKMISESVVTLGNKGLLAFSYNHGKTKITAQCES